MSATATTTPQYDRFASYADRLAALEALGDDARVFIPCGKCGGSGYIAGFGHIYEGVCFDCAGSRGKYRPVKRERANVKAAIRREAKRDAEFASQRAEAEAKRAAWVDANGDVYAALMEYADAQGGLGAGVGFMESMLASFTSRGELTEAQTEAVRKGIARKAEREAEKAPVVEGRGPVTGEVVKVDFQRNDFGTREVFTVRDDRGFMVWGTVPSGLGGVEKGDRVTFTATVEKSDRDESFGFAKRPSKASFVD